MQIKEGLKLVTSDFWYDLIDGGYLDPNEICKNKADAKKVNNAINTLIDFQRLCEDSILGLYI